MKRFLLLACATFVLAADLPKFVGPVNDFARKLSDAERKALETKLRNHERATSNEVVVAIVESLDNQTVEMYANRLFKAWGIGKKDRNNGGLLLWAPVERKVRIELGMGLEQAIPNSAADEINRAVTALFKLGEEVDGLNAGGDRIGAPRNSDGPRYRAT